MQNNWRKQPDFEWETGNFNFWENTPDLVYNFEKDDLGQVFARHHELRECMKHIPTVNILLWLGFWITDKEFEYLCAYFLEREFGYKTNVRWWFQDHWIDISWVKGTKENPEFIAMQCKQWNSWKINSRWASEVYWKMADVKHTHQAKLFLATLNYLNEWAWDFVEDKMEIWDYKTFLEYYKKYFFDADAWWEEFSYFIMRKKVEENERITIKQTSEVEKVEESKFKSGTLILKDTVKALYNLLKDVRMNEARKHNISPNYVFSNEILWEMAKRRPRSKLEFLQISWIGEVKYEKHCKAFAEVISNFR